MASTPAADGFHMPGEFEPHSGCWMLWPERPDNWREGALPAQRAYAAVAEAIAGCEQVTVGVSDARYEGCREMLSPAIRVVELASDDAWMRDLGPSFLLDGRGALAGVDWRFNAWGGRMAGSMPDGTATSASRARCSRSNGRPATRRRSCSRAARSTSMGRGRC